MITVLIADDHAVVRSGLRLLLESQDDIEVVEEAGNADEAVRHARLHKPDVVLLDVVMPGRSGIEAVPDILAGRQGRQGARALDAGRSRATCARRSPRARAATC